MPNTSSVFNMRFSDEKLDEFHSEFSKHVKRCEERFNAGDEQFAKLIEAQQKNTDTMSLLIDETREIVQLHRDIKGVTRMGKGLQSFMTWVIKWPLIGAGVYAGVSWVIRTLPS